jgi:hypothetical protein|nr:hypothetical protein [Parabacteroides goldsteinii]
MKTTEVTKEIIGKRCKCIFTSMMVTGTIEDIKTDKYAVNVKVRFDEPHQWGNEQYKSDWAFARLHDEFGSLHHLEIIDDKYQTLKVTFSQTIREINRMFVRDYSNWQTVNLKEWIDNYESSRFTQIDAYNAIITSEYNMEHIKEWLTKNTPLIIFEILI